jgi:hypothetical protein
MDVRQIAMMIAWLAVLGAIVLYGSRLAGRVASKAA